MVVGAEDMGFGNKGGAGSFYFARLFCLRSLMDKGGEGCTLPEGFWAISVVMVRIKWELIVNQTVPIISCLGQSNHLEGEQGSLWRDSPTMKTLLFSTSK